MTDGIVPHIKGKTKHIEREYLIVISTLKKWENANVKRIFYRVAVLQYSTCNSMVRVYGETGETEAQYN